MRTVLLVTFFLIGASSRASAFNGSFAGCGQLGTCASVLVSTQQQPDGSWRLTMVIRNTSYGHTSPTNPRSQAAGIRGFYIGGFPPPPPLLNPGRVISVFDEQGNDVGTIFNPDAVGQEIIGALGLTEETDQNGDVTHLTFGEIIDSRCAADPACAALRPPSTPTVTHIDFPGAITATFTFQFLPQNLEVWIADSGDFFQLTPVVATPEPLTMTLVATGLGLLGATRRRRKLQK
jgi:hypothetical protein